MNSIKDQSNKDRGLHLVVLMFLALSLTACGGNKKITTKDNSADYKSAQSLPPLKKPAQQVVEEASPRAAPVSQTPVIAEPINAETASASDDHLALNTNIVEDKPGESRLVISAEFEQAWNYLTVKLQKSDITVFSRNKAAGRFSIGCGNIAAAPIVTKSGRWSFLNRGKQEVQEYCALQAVSKRGVTNVSVLNRAGEEVTGEYSNAIFKRILNN